MMLKQKGLVFGLAFLLCLSFTTAFNYNVTQNSPGNNTNFTVNHVILNVSVLNTLNTGGNISNVTFFNGSGTALNTSNNVLNNTPVTYAWNNLADGTYLWYAIATGFNGTGISNNGTFTINATAPVLSNLTVTNINSTQVMINWSTDEGANSSLNIGPSPSLGTKYTNTSFTRQHSVIINLNPATLYYFVITSSDSLGNTGAAPMASFTTQGGSCFANSSGATYTILIAVGIFAVLAVGFLFLDGDLLSIEYLASCLVALIFVVTLVPGIC